MKILRNVIISEIYNVYERCCMKQASLCIISFGGRDGMFLVRFELYFCIYCTYFVYMCVVLYCYRLLCLIMLRYATMGYSCCRSTRHPLKFPSGTYQKTYFEERSRFGVPARLVHGAALHYLSQHRWQLMKMYNHVQCLAR